MINNFLQHLLTRHQQKRQIPSPIELEKFISGLLAILIPSLSDGMIHGVNELENAFEKNKKDLEKSLLIGKMKCLLT